MPSRLVVERMSSEALWVRAETLVRHLHPLHHSGPQEAEFLLDELKAVLKQLELRSKQTTLFPEAERSWEPGSRHPA